MRIYAVIATKNRRTLFERALISVLSQTRKADKIVVVCDSVDNTFERRLCADNEVYFLENNATHNYAGSLNTAIYNILQEEILLGKSVDDIYIATLDDDDIWDREYLKKAEDSIDGKDFLISGLLYDNGKNVESLSIPQSVSISDFLSGNPHIQGSNTFVKLTVLLRAGMFDENMSSTTDRDFFVRVMMLNPSYRVLNEHLVYADARDDRPRITNDKTVKADGLRKFYYKYRKFMSEEVKGKFFKRASEVFGVDENYLTKFSVDDVTLNRKFSDNTFAGHLIIGFIASEYELGLRLIEQIGKLGRVDTEIVVFLNFGGDKEQYRVALEATGCDFKMFCFEEFTRCCSSWGDDTELANTVITDGKVCDIAIARSILQQYIYHDSVSGDVIWILDDDMELRELVADGGMLHECEINLDRVIATYKEKYDAVVGQYCLDPPLPLLSTLRTSLLDYVYNSDFPIQSAPLEDKTDYYYDLSDCNSLHLETPFALFRRGDLKDIFAGHTLSRPLYLRDGEVVSPRGRGGNTLIFNKDLLKVSNDSIRVGDRKGRRGDYFWVLSAQRMGYRIASAPFATLHNRKKQEFDIVREQDKLIADIIGAAFTKAVRQCGMQASSRTFAACYRGFYLKRLVKCVANYYRIQGLLSITGDGKYANLFADTAINDFIRIALVYGDIYCAMAAHAAMEKRLNRRACISMRDKFKDLLVSQLGLREDVKMIGSGAEGIVFTDTLNVYKIFFNTPDNLEFLCEKGQLLGQCPQMYSVDVINVGGYTVLKYKFEQSETYHGGHSREIINLLRFAKENGIVFENFKKENFILTENGIKLIDYGRSLLPFSADAFAKSVKRAYQMLRYYFLDEQQFTQLVCMDYDGLTDALNSGCENLMKAVGAYSKESLHDDIILDILHNPQPERVLDYGAGKCKIANRLSDKCDVSVYDIDLDILNDRANKTVKILKTRNEIAKNSFDAVICNLVLCCIDDASARMVVFDIAKALKNGGKAVISICNPFFNGVKNTLLRQGGIEGKYGQSQMFVKRLVLSSAEREEFHRPIEFYELLLRENGLTIDNVFESGGVDTDNLTEASEFLIFECTKIAEPFVADNLTLLVKACPMEYDCIYDNVRHIVTELSNGIRFFEKIVVVDLTSTDERARKYAEDDEHILLRELERAKDNGLIDRIISASDNDGQIKCVYEKYFAKECDDGHSENGQGLFATLYAFDNVKTPYVFQTDSDIVFHVGSQADFLSAYKMTVDGAVTVAPSIARKRREPERLGCRCEVRCCFLNLYKLKDFLPLPNRVDKGRFVLAWHRGVDSVLPRVESVRLHGGNFWFVHPENKIKSRRNFIARVRDMVECSVLPERQYGAVNVVDDVNEWIPHTEAEVVIFIRGRNTPATKLKRLFDSLKRQSYDRFSIVYVDDASENESGAYAKFVLRNDSFFKGRTIALFNDTNIGALENFVVAMQNVITNKNAIVINVDNDDFLVNDDAIGVIVSKFEHGADLTCGNCVRYDKPLKKYSVKSFERVWERNGDNIWVHPKCFRRWLFDAIDIDTDLKIDGEYVTVDEDFAVMLPMISKARKCEFICDIVYYFEPSFDNVERTGRYSDENKAATKSVLLDNARRKYYGR